MTENVEQRYYTYDPTTFAFTGSQPALAPLQFSTDISPENLIDPTFDTKSNQWVEHDNNVTPLDPTKQPTLASAMVMLGQVVAENAALKSENTTLQKSQSATDMKAQQALTLAGSLVAQLAALNKPTTGGTN